MTEAERFEKLMESNPASAMKYVKEFEETAFWHYFRAYMATAGTDRLGLLYTCEIKDIKRIRGEIKAHTELLDFPKQITEQLKDEIALQKEAAKIEEARQPEEFVTIGNLTVKDE